MCRPPGCLRKLCAARHGHSPSSEAAAATLQPGEGWAPGGRKQPRGRSSLKPFPTSGLKARDSEQ